MGISAKEAATLVGMSKAGIMKAIRTGKLSATKDLNGEWDIEPVELFRVYAPLSTSEHPKVEVSDESVVTQTEHLRTQLALQREIIDKQEETIRILNERLQAQDKVTLQLTDKSLAALADSQPNQRSFWEWIAQRGKS